MKNKNADPQHLRREYPDLPLLEAAFSKDPFKQFKAWFEEAVKSAELEPNAMCLSTCGGKKMPHSRIVLLRKISPKGFVFFTNYKSSKGEDIKNNPYACLLFYWPTLSRQLRITGRIMKISRKESQAYFRSRPQGAQIAAAISSQSKIIKNRSVLESEFKKLRLKYADNPIPCPKDWGGYQLIPKDFEFWQGRRNRLHDRLAYRRPAKGTGWKIVRLAP
jgi:pyridoxamine 5'-phosphate oxidase